jgi:hypothetical protein
LVLNARFLIGPKSRQPATRSVEVALDAATERRPPGE